MIVKIAQINVSVAAHALMRLALQRRDHFPHGPCPPAQPQQLALHTMNFFDKIAQRSVKYEVFELLQAFAIVFQNREAVVDNSVQSVNTSGIWRHSSAGRNP